LKRIIWSFESEKEKNDKIEERFYSDNEQKEMRPDFMLHFVLFSYFIMSITSMESIT